MFAVHTLLFPAVPFFTLPCHLECLKELSVIPAAFELIQDINMSTVGSVSCLALPKTALNISLKNSFTCKQ